MALQKSLVHLNLTGGADGKGDDFLTDPSKLDLAQNVEFDDSNTVRTRGGQVKSTLPSGPVTAVRMFQHKEVPVIEVTNGQMIRANNSTSLSYLSEATDTRDLYEPIAFPRVGVTTRRVAALKDSGFSNLLSAAGFDVAYGTTTYATLTIGELTASTGGNSITLTIRSIADDREIDIWYVNSDSNNDTIILPRVIYDSTNDRFALFRLHMNTTGNLHSVRCGYIAAVGGSGLVDGGTIMTFNGALGAASQMDAAISQGHGYVVVARGNGATTLRMILLNLDLSVNTAEATKAVTQPGSLTAYATWSSGGGGVLTGHAFYAGNTSNLYGCSFPSSTGIISAEVTIRATGLRYGRIVAYEFESNHYLGVDIFDPTATGTVTAYTDLMLINISTYAVTVDTKVYADCFIAGRQFTLRGRSCLPLVFTSKAYQGVVLVADITSGVGLATTPSPCIVARIGYGEVNYNSDIEISAGLISRVPGTHASLLPFVATERDQRLAGTTSQTPLALHLATFAPTEQLGDAEINGTTFLAGALPLICDGRGIVEEGFHWGPELKTSALVPLADNPAYYTFPETGSHTVVFTLAWQDAQGNWHESAPSPEYEVTIVGGTQSINPALALPPSLKRNVFLLMYRTLASSTDTSLYLAHTASLESFTRDSTIRFVTSASTAVTSATLIYGEQLYTAGNVLPNTPAPPCRHVSVFQKRLVLSGCGDGSEVHWSKQSTPGYGVEFSVGDPTHQTTVPRKAGRVVATQEMDDRLWLVCENSVGVISGTGPDPTGTQGQYSDFSTAIAEIGASWDSPKSVVRGPEGIWFRSPFGIRLASRSGGLARGQSGQDLGAEVDDLVSGNLVATVGSSTQQIRFYQSSGSVLVWDYQFGQWSQFTGFANVDAVYAGGRHYHLSNVSTTPLLRYTSSTAYVDVNDAGTANSLFTSTVRTGWLSLAGIQGFQRAYRLMILGKSVGGEGAQAWDIAGTLYYDFVSSSGTETFSTTATPSGGVIQLQHHMAKQKCEAIKIQLTFTPDTSSMDYAFRITDLTLQVGLKPGYFKLPSSKRI